MKKIFCFMMVLSLLSGFAIAKGDHLLITEVAMTPTPGEFIEIYNPTLSTITLTNYYLADDASYWKIVNNTQTNSVSDFFTRFPSGSTITSHQVIVIATQSGDTGFFGVYSTHPDYEIINTSGVPDMLAAQTGSIGSGPTLTNAGECVVLYKWDGVSDLVQDGDMVNVGVPTLANSIQGSSKAGVTVGASTYPANAYTMNNMASTPGVGSAAARPDTTEGTEAIVNGSGITGDDETSENTGTTWVIATTSPGIFVVGASQISNHLRLPFVPNNSQSAMVSAIIQPSGGNTITAATTTWTVNNIAQTPIQMTFSGSTYSATLGGEPDGSVVLYTITGYDSGNNSVSVSSGYIVGTTAISFLRAVDINGIPIYNGLAARAKGVATVANNGESFVTGNIMSIYIQDTSGSLGASGINVFTRSSALNVNRGDIVVAEGAVTNFNGSLELAVDTVTGPTQGSVSNIGAGSLPSPILLPSITYLNESYEGLLVKIADCISSFTTPTTTSNQSFYRSGNPSVNGTLRVQSTLNVNIPQFPPSYPVQITGIVSQNDGSSPYTGSYQLIPRSTTDFSSGTLVVVSEQDLNVKLGDLVNFTVSGGSGTYTWSINSAGGATGTLNTSSGSSVTLTVGNLVGTLYLTVQDSGSLVGSSGVLNASATDAPLLKEFDNSLIQDKREIFIK